ncbi:MAG: rod shape-determining protein [Lachnospiraceae bacterium]|nr:rod shape-determining protein [Lachnospiraceae bacterium]
MFTRNLFGIDLGTSMVKIYSHRKNRLLCEHDMIAIRGGSQVIAVGDDAYEMFEKNPPDVIVDRPIVNGRVADVAEIEMLLGVLLRKTDRTAAARPSICFSAPVNMSEIEKRAYFALSNYGSVRNPRVRLVDRPVCDALSCGIQIEKTKGSMILDIGARSTEVSVIAGNQIIVSDSLPIGGQNLNDAVADEIRRSRNLLIGNRTARRLKISLSTFEAGEEEFRSIRGIDTLSGLPREDTVSSRLIERAVTAEMSRGAEVMKAFLERTPPQITDSIVSEGIYVAGGTARIPGIERFLARKIGCRINLSPDYELSTVKGLMEIISNKELKGWAHSVKDRT